jgi:hypothetical protein
MEKAEPVARSDALSNRELALSADSLATAADEFADRSCNDFSFPTNVRTGVRQNNRLVSAPTRFPAKGVAHSAIEIQLPTPATRSSVRG